MKKSAVPGASAHSDFLCPKPRHWLRQAIERSALSCSAVARQIGKDPAQLSRWLRGSERIPRSNLMELAELLSPEELDYVDNLKATEQLQLDLYELMVGISAGDREFIEFFSSCFLRKLRTVLEQELDCSHTELARTCVSFLTAAQFAVRRGKALLESPDQALVSIENIASHIRYPYNHFIGVLLELPNDPSCPKVWRGIFSDIRHHALRSLRKSANSPSPSGPVARFITPHARHLLARHGEPADREMLARTLSRDIAPADAMSRRLVFAGLSLSGTAAAVTGQYLRDLQQDETLRVANIAFDTVHYRDIDIRHLPSAVIADAYAPRNTLRHLLRHIIFEDHYRSIQAVEEQTVLDIYSLFGPDSFRDRAVIVGLQRCLTLQQPNLLSGRFLDVAASILEQPGVLELLPSMRNGEIK